MRTRFQICFDSILYFSLNKIFQEVPLFGAVSSRVDDKFDSHTTTFRENNDFWACSAYSLLEQVRIYIRLSQFNKCNDCLLASYSRSLLVKDRTDFQKLNCERSISTRKMTSISTWNSYCVGHTILEQSPTVIVLITQT